MNPLRNPDVASRVRRPPDWLLCAVLTAVWFGATAGLRPLAIPDEGRYVGVAWEMLRSADWLVPTQNGHPFFHKPPLFYWITAASMALFGPGAWAARLASVLATTLVVAVLFRVVARWNGRRLAWTVAAVLATMPLFYGSSQYANLDPLVAACISIAILLVAHTALSQESGSPSRGALPAAFAVAACGVLAKGMIGIVLPVLVLLGWGFATGRTARLLRLIFWLPGWLIFLVVAAPWFIAMQLQFPDFGHYFFVVQHLQRFIAAGFNNAQPFWFYPALLALGTFPWSPWAVVLLGAAFWQRPDPRGLRRLMLVWAGTVTLFFSLPHSKPIGYILPALPPLGWLLADAIESVRQRVAGRITTRPGRFGPRLRAATAGLAASVCVTAVITEHFFQPKSRALIAAQLQARRLPGEQVVFVGNYYFDVPFYARLDAPVVVVDHWHAADIARDSWRRELVDAEAFRRPGWEHRLLRYDEIGPLLRSSGEATWIIGPAVPGSDVPGLSTLPPVYQHDGTALWRVPSPAAAGNATPAP